MMTTSLTSCCSLGIESSQAKTCDSLTGEEALEVDPNEASLGLRECGEVAFPAVGARAESVGPVTLVP